MGRGLAGRIYGWFKRLFLVGLLVGLGLFALSATVGTGISAIDEPVDGLLTEEPLNETQIERAVHAEINDVRRERDLSTLEFDPDLAEVARYHSEDMAENDYYSHRSPSGENVSDRYDRFDYDCRVQMSERKYMSGSENIAFTFADRPVETQDGATISHDRNETKIGRGLVRQWMNSESHRRNILISEWTSEGVGVAVTETDGSTKVLATQNFC